ncbi:hypothetical protein UlMin_029257 [Ulmus minor]
MGSSSKPFNPSKQKPFFLSLIFLSLTLLLLILTFRPKPNFFAATTKRIQTLITVKNPAWFTLIAGELKINKKIKLGLVNLNDDELDVVRGGSAEVETVEVGFQRLDSEKISRKWEDFFPEWIDEDRKWGPPKCPEIPMPRLSEYDDLDVVVARVPCGFNYSVNGTTGIRDVFRLKVNLVVANLAVRSGWAKSDLHRTVYVVFVGSCKPMLEIFRCDDLVMRRDDYWVYKPELGRLKQKLLMPVGSCQLAPAYSESGKETWRYTLTKSTLQKNNQTTFQERYAYVSILHSSEAYVCGAIALAQSIRQSNSSKDLLLLIDETIGPKSIMGLKLAGWKIRPIKRIKSPFSQPGSYNEWNYSKLRIWELIEYDKIIFVDSDLIILNNIDHLFVHPQLSASANDKVLFNSGLMVIEPSKCLFKCLTEKMAHLASYNGGDQGFLNEVFTWWHRLPKRVNYLKVFRRSAEENHDVPGDLEAIHFLGLKPWMCYRDYDCNWDMADHHIFASDSAHWRWWKVHNAMPRRLQGYCGLTKKMDSRIKKWRGRAKESRLPDGHWQIQVKDPRSRRLSG